MQTSPLEKLLLPEIKELIGSKDFTTLHDVLQRWDPADVGALVSDLEPDDRTAVFRSLETSTASRAFAYLDLDVQEQLVESLPAAELAKVLNGMAPDDRTKLLGDLPKERTQRLLSLLTADERKVAESLLAF